MVVYLHSLLCMWEEYLLGCLVLKAVAFEVPHRAEIKLEIYDSAF